ncbi:hypothetical protein ACO1ZL_23880 [Escherichia coli]|uniref:hypothetical protein n=1 Tax=Escherichia coli TaxID=562 RepID=UPI001D6B77B2|nr:hypothetical protein [Escherichia coli]
MSKNGFDPAIKSGVHRFQHLGQWATVCYCGSSLVNFSYGDRVFFQSEAGYWLGIIECDCFVFIVNEPIKTVLEGMHYLYTEGEMVRIHDEDGWFCEQGELPL